MPFRFVLILGAGIVMGFGLSLGRTVQAEREIEHPPVATAKESTVPWQDARLLAEVLERVRKEYVDDVTDQELIEAAIRGMISDLDAHSLAAVINAEASAFAGSRFAESRKG